MVARAVTSTSGSSSDCIAALSCHTARSGYRGVCRASRNAEGVDVWRAYVKECGVKRDLGVRSPDRQVCARAVAAWYAAEFGPDWPRAVAARKRNPFAVRRSPKYGGYVAAVWVLGRREEVWALRRGRRNAWHTTDALAVFPTAAAARAGIRRYLRLRYGLFAGCVLRRGA